MVKKRSQHQQPRDGTASQPEVFVGTSGWTYKDWRESFYPLHVSKKAWLHWYATQFTTTEINGSFYRTPSLEAVKAWWQQTPDNFVFAWKASKFITHWKRLSDKCRSSLALMETRLKVLGSKLGPVLFQLPPRFQADREKLAGFLQLLNQRRKYAFEFRHESWYEPAILDLLRDFGAALCISDHHDAPAPWMLTAPHVYIRGHGPTGRYKDRYPVKTLRLWARTVRSWQRERRNIFCYFDNDQKTAAPQDAVKLTQLLNDPAD